MNKEACAQQIRQLHSLYLLHIYQYLYKFYLFNYFASVENTNTSSEKTALGAEILRSWHNNGLLNHKPLMCTGSIALNSAPITRDQMLTTVVNAALPIDLTALDENHATLSYQLLTQPDSGQLSGSLPHLLYKADNNTGTSSFSYQVTDELGQVSVAEVTITIKNNNSTNIFNKLLTQTLAIVPYGEEQ